MTMNAINRDIQAREFLSIRPTPDGLAKKYNYTFSGVTTNNTPTELFLPGNEILVPEPRTLGIVQVTWILSEDTEAFNESSAKSEAFGGFRFYIRSNGTATYLSGYNGIIVGAPPTDNSIAVDYAPLPNVPSRNYIRVRVRGTNGSRIGWGLFMTAHTAPRVSG